MCNVLDIFFVDSYFQLHLSGMVTCSDLMVSSLCLVSIHSFATLNYSQVSSTNETLGNITNTVLEELSTSCAECGITNDTINEQSFVCFPESPTYVTYRARLEGTSETDSGSLISLIEEWVSGGASIIVTGVQMTVDSECSVAISSLSEGECSPTIESTTTTTDNTIFVIIGGVVAVILIVAITVAAVAAVALIIKNCRKLSVKE